MSRSSRGCALARGRWLAGGALSKLQPNSEVGILTLQDLLNTIVQDDVHEAGWELNSRLTCFVLVSCLFEDANLLNVDVPMPMMD